MREESKQGEMFQLDDDELYERNSQANYGAPNYAQSGAAAAANQQFASPYSQNLNAYTQNQVGEKGR